MVIAVKAARKDAHRMMHEWFLAREREDPSFMSSAVSTGGEDWTIFVD